MPNRIIKESICTSESIDRLSWFEECFFYRLIVNCDDYGRMDARPAILKARLFPLKERITRKDIESALVKLADIGCVKLYECDSKPYLYLPAWEAHQSIRAKKSKYPPPDGVSAHEIICNQMQADESKCPRNPNPNTNPIREYENIPAREKKQFGEFGNVKLTDEEYEKLCSRFSKEETDKTIEDLSGYMQSKGKAYKDHYATLINWCKRNLEKSGKKPTTNAAPTKDEYERMKRYLAKIKGDDDG